ncbi:MAG: chemotaxis protein CheA [Albidovulum sp.]|uniref:chemotaxis protein CheA n=1 Tax=Albidovulum sp. TaxID=1872424 RepID=UPI003CB057DD
MADQTDPLATIRAGFFNECAERLEQLNDALSDLGEGGMDGAADPEIINTAFRAVHSIKGGAASFGLDALVRFAHSFEAALEQVRSTAALPAPERLTLMHRAADHLTDLVAACATGDALPPPGDDIAAQLLAPGNGDAGLPVAPETGDRPWRVRFCPRKDLYASGNDPLFPLRALRDLGATRIACDPSCLPDLAGFDPEAAYLVWTISLPPTVARSEILDVFDFVADLCDLDIAQEDIPATPTATGTAQTALSEQSPTMRVDLERIDRLMNLVGELAIGHSILSQRLSEATSANPADLTQHVDTLTGLTRDIQDSVMAIRAQPVKSLFQRMGRVLRETSAALGKPARLVLEGEMTEVDRTVIERLTDPLTHMVRNAIDHGLEPPQDRERAGKAAQGTVTLSAAHRAGRLVIELADDGRGIDRDRILASAEKRGLIAAGAQLTDAEIDQFLFAPGFSTARTLSDISGRGVGMDVVKTAIKRLGGRITIRSEAGAGTWFTLSLPLTLAVMDGMVVRIAGQTMVIPVAAILETAALNAVERRPLGDDTTLLNMRGSYAALVDTAAALGMRPPGRLPRDPIAILTQADDDSRAALVVDAVLDQRQVVVKPVRGGFGRIPGIAAATILGDGEIALILDPGETARLAPPRHKEELHARTG